MSQHSSYKNRGPKRFVSQFSTIISIAIVLYIYGFLCFLTISFDQHLNNLKEQIPFYIEIKDNAHEASVFAFQKKLQANAYVKLNSVEYLTKDVALSVLQDDDLLTQEEILLFGENVLPNMIRFCVKEEFFHDYKKIVSDIQSYNFIELVSFSESRIQNLESKVFPYQIILLVLMIFFIFVLNTLTINKLKLVLFSDIKVVRGLKIAETSIQLISKPYFVKCITNYLISGGLALFGIWATWLFMNSLLGPQEISNIKMWSVIFSSILLFIGILFSCFYFRHTIHKIISKPVDEWYH